MTTSTWIFSDWQWGIYTDTLHMRWGRYYEDAIRWYWEPTRRSFTRPALVRWTVPRG